MPRYAGRVSATVRGSTLSHIVSFKVGGLAGRREVYARELNRDINLFFGLNGSGKTSLIRILRAAMRGETHSLRHVPFEWAEVSIYSMNFDRVFTRSFRKDRLMSPEPDEDSEIESFEIVESETSKAEWTTEPAHPEQVTRTRWQHRYLPTSRLYVVDASIGHTYHQRPTEDFYWDSLFADHLMSLWRTYTNDLLMRIRTIQDEGLERILRSILSPDEREAPGAGSTDPDIAYRKVQSFFAHRNSRLPGTKASFAERYATNRQLRQVVSDIEEIEAEIEGAAQARNDLERLITRLFSGPKKLKFSDRGILVTDADGAAIGLGSLSSGEKQLLLILIEALLAEGNSLMIDEPEISLHVDWQRTLIAAMHTLNPKAQIIVATHSPEVMAEV